MFEKYYNEQPVVSTTLINAINNNKLSHAYIFEINNYVNYLDYIYQFVKYIVCPNAKDENHNEEECPICAAINSNNYVELKIIDTDLLQIKKEQLLDLQREFKTKPIEGNKKIYIILNAEKLNSSSANTILKFLEEPEEGIIAILITPSRYMVMETILSRCQIIAFSKIGKSNYDIVKKVFLDFYNESSMSIEVEEEVKNTIAKSITFARMLDDRKKDALLFYGDKFSDIIGSREQVIKLFSILNILYYDVLKYKIGTSIQYFNEYEEDIKYLANLNTVDELINKLQEVADFNKKIKYNVNINLAIDKFIINLGGK